MSYTAIPASTFITIPNPDDPTAPIYDGPLESAAINLIAGMYPGKDESDNAIILTVSVVNGVRTGSAVVDNHGHPTASITLDCGHRWDDESCEH